MSSIANQRDMKDLVEELKLRVSGEVHFDKMTRVMYSTDASIYRIEPIGVIIPKTAEDVIAVIETANRHNIPVLPRGGGTSLAGQTVGHALVIDFSKYMRRMIEINAEERWVRTQPGIILDELNRHLEPQGMMFAPDPSTSNRANVGGALGNNSCGAHSIMWGKTIDNILELETVLSDGSTAHFGRLNGEQMETKKRCNGLEGNVYRRLAKIAENDRKEILKRYPRIQRRVSGYNLDEFVRADDFNMARFVVGSEGTLVAITEAKLRIVERPKHKGLALLHFDDLLESMEATIAILDLDPAAVELIGNMILRQARSNLQYSRMMDFVDGDPDALLVTELVGESEAEVADKMDKLENRLQRSGLGCTLRRIMQPEDQAKVWSVRKAGLGLMMNAPGDAKPLAFVEDTAVSPELLPQFVKRFGDIVQDHGTTAGYYGHAGVGCLHIRPLINLKIKEGVDQMLSIATQVSDLVLEFGGSMSGEHGDGLARSIWNKKMFGPQLYDAFRQVKQAFDPNGIMNPGKIVDAAPMTNNLRVSPTYRTLESDSSFAFQKEGGLAKAVEMCNGQGACRKVTEGTMCPSYMVTRDEEHSTRGRANALLATMSGILPKESLTSRRLFDTLDLCLECKGCKAECPSNVDMAKLKYEFLNKYHQVHGHSLRNDIVGNIATLSKWGSFLSPISNWPLSSGYFRNLLEKLAGIDKRRELPNFSSQTFVQWFRSRGGSPASTAVRGKVLLFPDTFTNYNHPNLGIAATTLLESIGYQVILPSVKCCSRPMLSNGMMEKAQSNARFNIESVYPYVKSGVKLVGLEPSCILNFRDDYVDLLGGDAKAKIVSENTMLIEEFILFAQQKDGALIEFKDQPGRVLFHGHCHQKALVGTGAAMEVLNSIPGCEPLEIKSGCCGMAGSFGFEKEHHDISMQIGDLALFPAIRSQQGDFVVVTEGVSCRQQIEHGTGKKAKHLVEILAGSV